MGQFADRQALVFCADIEKQRRQRGETGGKALFHERASMAARMVSPRKRGGAASPSLMGALTHRRSVDPNACRACAARRVPRWPGAGVRSAPSRRQGTAPSPGQDASRCASGDQPPPGSRSPHIGDVVMVARNSLVGMASVFTSDSPNDLNRSSQDHGKIATVKRQTSSGSQQKSEDDAVRRSDERRIRHNELIVCPELATKSSGPGAYIRRRLRTAFWYLRPTGTSTPLHSTAASPPLGRRTTRSILARLTRPER